MYWLPMHVRKRQNFVSVSLYNLHTMCKPTPVPPALLSELLQYTQRKKYITFNHTIFLSIQNSYL